MEDEEDDDLERFFLWERLFPAPLLAHGCLRGNGWRSLAAPKPSPRLSGMVVDGCGHSRIGARDRITWRKVRAAKTAGKTMNDGPNESIRIAQEPQLPSQFQ